jgi:hypothetical protein
VAGALAAAAPVVRAAGRAARAAGRAAARRRAEIAGLGVLVAVAAAFLSPALAHGLVPAPMDAALATSSLGAGVYPHVHNGLEADVATEMLPWQILDWRLIHAGVFPLWNPYSGLGMPEFFNFQSAVLGLPELVSYLFPLRLSFLVVLLVRLLLAGTGVYVLLRVLGSGPLGAATAGVVYMASGGFVGWLGWSLAGVAALAGWVAAFAVLVYRRPSSPLRALGLALATAWAIYAGFPEMTLMVALGVAVLLGAGLAAGLARRERPSLRGAVAAAAAVAAGMLLAAPLWLPGAGVLEASARALERRRELPASCLALLVAPGYDGSPLSTSRWFGPVNYYETAVYVGVPALALAAVALGRWPRRKAVVGLAVLAVLAAAAVYRLGPVDPLPALLSLTPLKVVAWSRARAVLDFALAGLAGFGADALVRNGAERRTLLALAAGAALAALACGALVLLAGSGRMVHGERPIRMASLDWPVASVLATAALALGAAVTLRVGRPATRGSGDGPSATGRVVGVAALALEAAFLLAAGAPLPTYTHRFLPESPAQRHLASIVGNRLVALDGTNTGVPTGYGGVGYYPELNVAYEVHELAIYDPALPRAYLESLPDALPPPATSFFVPQVGSASVARLYGASYILAAPGRPRPSGTVPVATIAGAVLYRVPGASPVGFLPGSPRGARVLRIVSGAGGGLSVVVATPRPARLVVRLDLTGGWTAALDGRPARLAVLDHLFGAVTVPAGRHRVEIAYWATGLGRGLGLALGGVTALAAWAAFPRLTRRRRARREATSPATGASDSAESPVERTSDVSLSGAAREA